MIFVENMLAMQWMYKVDGQPTVN